MTRDELSAVFGKTPREVVDWLRSKELATSWSYRDIYGEAHRRTFTVAKVMKLDLLADIHASLTDALEDGVGFDEWKKRLRPTLAAKGWYGRTEVVNPETGEVKTITVGSRRLRTIYETNIRSAYNHGRRLHQLSSPSMEYWMYVSALLPTTRPTHRAMHGRVYPRSHPFWEANYPPNGYNCRCKVRAYSKEMIRRRDLRVTEDDDYETIADPGFTHPPSEGLANVWDRKILDAPSDIRKLAKIEKDLSDLYDGAFDRDERLRQILLDHKPDFVYAPTIEPPISYRIRQKAIFYKQSTTIDQIRHEAGHHLDNLAGFPSAGLYNYALLDRSRWTKSESIADDLARYSDDVYFQDLFYLTSGGAVGEQTRRDTYANKFRIHAEIFANFFLYHIADDTEKLGLIERYFPSTWPRFLQLIDRIKANEEL